MKAIAVCSGGLDSTVMLYDMINRGIEPVVLSFNYGQRHRIELAYIEATANKLNVKWILSEFPHIGGDALSGDRSVPKASYDDETQKATVSPNRNMIMLSIAGGFAVREHCGEVWYAAHGGDHAIYPDCRPPFVHAVSTALVMATYEGISIHAPYLYKSKSEIVQIGHSLGVPFKDTWSCYDPVRVIMISTWSGPGATSTESDVYVHCGQCGTCRERIEAFEKARVRDPTSYVKSKGEKN